MLTSRRLNLLSISISISVLVAVGGLVACSVKTVTVDPAAAATDPTATDPSADDSGTTDPTGTDGATPDASKPDAAGPPPGCTTKRFYLDADGDGFGTPGTFMDVCVQPSGYVTNDTDCDDTKAAVNPAAVQLCDAVDNNCSGSVNGTSDQAAACTAKAGGYAGTFSLVTQEKVGTTVVNSMTCTGSTTITIDLSANTVIAGNVTCTYSGGLTAFDHNQTGTIAATVRPDGTVSGTLTQVFSIDTTHTFSIGGTASGTRVDSTTNTTWLPNPMSAVPWDTTITISTARN